MEYITRRSETYYIYAGRTKAGKAKYYASKKPTSDGGMRIDRLPDDFEIHERQTNGMVTVRKRVPSKIQPWELDLVNRLASELCPKAFPVCRVEGDSLVLYTVENAEREIGLLKHLAVNPARFGASDWFWKNASYDAVLRFVLANDGDRLYRAQRYCFRGDVDNWIAIPSAQSVELATLAERLLPQVGNESFYELGVW